MAQTVHFISLGCTKNLVDTEVMLGKLAHFEITDDAAVADVIIINTCGFIDAAKEESINTILLAHEMRKEDSVLVVSGCLTQRYQEELQKELPEVDLFTGVGDYARIDELLAQKSSRFSNEVYLIDEEQRIITGSHFHAYIKIAEGCNQQCSFCAIPSFKGALHSRTLSSIVKEVTRLVAQGYFDFSFVAQDSSSYLRDMGKSDGLIELIHAIEAIEGVKSARILYLYPSTTSYALIDTIANSKVFCNYFDMPIQHIDDGMLKTMRRGFGQVQTQALLEHMRAISNSYIGTSVIIGHPHESDEAFNALKEFVQSFGFDRVNIFAYSNEEGTKAYDMPQIDEDTVNQRIDELQEIVARTTTERLESYINETIKVVVLGPSDEHEYLLSARALMWAPDIDGEIYINETDIEPVEFGRPYYAKITDIAGDILLAHIISHA